VYTHLALGHLKSVHRAHHPRSRRTEKTSSLETRL
jgi:site-specific recombinase XerC